MNTQIQNDKGQWVPAIPEPLYEWFDLKKCKCGRMFWTKEGYRAHYALAHILFLGDGLS